MPAIQVVNDCSFPINIYNTFVENPPTATKISTNIYDYWETYTLLGEVSSNSSKLIALVEPALSRLVITRKEDEFPILLYMFDPPLPGEEGPSLKVTEQMLTRCQAAWSFYRFLRSQPYAPLSILYHQVLKGTTQALEARENITQLLQSNGYDCGYNEVSLVTFWAYTYLYAYPGTYYVYQGADYVESSNFIMESKPLGEIHISGNIATFTLSNGSKEPLFYNYGVLSKRNNHIAAIGTKQNPASDITGWTLVLRDLSWEGQPDKIVACFLGTTKDSVGKKQMIAQPYQNPNLPWWVAAYDLAYLGFCIAEVGMTLNTAIDLLKGVKGGLVFLSKNLQKFFQSSSYKLAEQGKFADPFSDPAIEGKNITPVNIDIDIDTVLDTDTDDVNVEDTDTVSDIDTVIDDDTIVDTDVDVFAIIDADVDVIIDSDDVTDIDDVHVEDTDTDIDTVVDNDIDTSMVVGKGMATLLLRQIGGWIMKNGSGVFRELVKNLVIMFAFQAAGELFKVWRKSIEEELITLSPQESTGLGLLINYMLNPSNSIQTRWVTFGDFVQQSEMGVEITTAKGLDELKYLIGQQMMLLTNIMMTPSKEDEISWSQKSENELILQMSQYKTPEDQYKAYSEVLANYTVSNRSLPIKTGCSISKKYLTKILVNL